MEDLVSILREAHTECVRNKDLSSIAFTSEVDYAFERHKRKRIVPDIGFIDAIHNHFSEKSEESVGVQNLVSHYLSGYFTIQKIEFERLMYGHSVQHEQAQPHVEKAQKALQIAMETNPQGRLGKRPYKEVAQDIKRMFTEIKYVHEFGPIGRDIMRIDERIASGNANQKELYETRERLIQNHLPPLPPHLKKAYGKY